MNNDDKTFFLTMFGLTAATVVATGYVLHNDIKSMKMMGEPHKQPIRVEQPIKAEQPIRANIKKMASIRRERLRTKKLFINDEDNFRQEFFGMS